MSKTNKRNYKSKDGKRPNFDKSKGNGVKPSSKGERYEDCTTNDISWWNKSPLYPLATSIQYNKIPGYLYDNLNFTRTGGDNTLGNVHAEPGVFRIDYIPTVGDARNTNSPVNLCFNSLMAELVAHTNSANVGFQQADIALLTLATSSIITQIAEIERICGITNLYFRENANFPRAIMTALGVELDDISDNKAQYILRLQTLVQNFNALRIPSYIDLFKRAMQMGRNIYMDEDSVMGQIYLFRSLGYYVYNDRQMSLEWHVYSGTTVEEKLEALQASLEALRNTSDLGNVMGALRRAFPDTAVITLDIPTTAEVISPVWDRNVTWQINNAEFTSVMPDGLDVTQSPSDNSLICTPYFNDFEVVPWRDDVEEFKHTLSSFNGEIGNEFVMEATRFKFNTEFDDKYHYITDFGTEICVDAAMIIPVQGEEGAITYTQLPVPVYLNTDTTTAATWNGLTNLSRFRNHPYIELFSGTNSRTYGLLGDKYVWTELSSEDLHQINLAALQSIYLITTIGMRQI